MVSTRIPHRDILDKNPVLAKLGLYLKQIEINSIAQNAPYSAACHGGFPRFFFYLIDSLFKHCESQDTKTTLPQNLILCNAVLNKLKVWNGKYSSLSDLDIQLFDQFLNLIDFSQSKILEKRQIYISARDNTPLPTNRDPGKCGGFSITFLEAMTSEQECLSSPTNQQNKLVWLADTIIKIILWDNNISSLSSEDKIVFEHFFKVIDAYQQIQNHNETLEKLNFGSDKTLKKEYSLGGKFTQNDLLRIHKVEVDTQIKKENFIRLLTPENRCVLVQSFNHSISLFKANRLLTFCDSNHPLGPLEFEDDKTTGVVIALTKAFRYQPSIPSPINFRIFSLDDKKINYPPRERLLSFYKKLDASFADTYANGTTALHIAVFAGCIDSVKVHLSYDKTEINTLFNNHSSNLGMATEFGNLRLVKTLIKYGADVNLINPRHKLTALHIAIERNHYDIAKLLLSSGANPNMVSDIGTPLHIAASYKNKNLVDLLLTFQADINIRDQSGKLAEDKTQDPEIVALFKAQRQRNITQLTEKIDKQSTIKLSGLKRSLFSNNNSIPFSSKENNQACKRLRKS